MAAVCRRHFFRSAGNKVAKKTRPVPSGHKSRPPAELSAAGLLK